ncbi:MAG: hypothetical protein R3B13_30020 [Polyangiaceae bacterium]
MKKVLVGVAFALVACGGDDPGSDTMGVGGAASGGTGAATGGVSGNSGGAGMSGGNGSGAGGGATGGIGNGGSGGNSVGGTSGAGAAAGSGGTTSSGGTGGTGASLNVLVDSTFDFSSQSAFLASPAAKNFFEWRSGSHVSFGPDPADGTHNVLILDLSSNEAEAAISFEVPNASYANGTQAGARIIRWTWQEYRDASFDYAGEKFLRAVARLGSESGGLAMDIIPLIWPKAQTSGHDAVGSIQLGAQSTLVTVPQPPLTVQVGAGSTPSWLSNAWNQVEVYIDTGDHDTNNGSCYLKLNGAMAGQTTNVKWRIDYNGQPYFFQQIWLGGWWSNGTNGAPSPGTNNKRYIKNVKIEWK